MSCNMMTLHEIGMAWAKKQPGIIDDLTEDSPILDIIKWKAASHKLWNVAEKLVDIDGPGWTEPDAPLPMMQASTDLVHVDLHVLGGQMEVTTQKALKFGGPKKYFADRQNWILRYAGMTTEKQIVLKNLLKAATTWKNKAGVRSNLYDAGGSDKGWFILALSPGRLPCSQGALALPLFASSAICSSARPASMSSIRILRIARRSSWASGPCKSSGTFNTTASSLSARNTRTSPIRRQSQSRAQNRNARASVPNPTRQIPRMARWNGDHASIIIIAT